MALRVSELYDQIVDEFGIPAQALECEAKEVRKYLSNLSEEKLQKIELHVRRLHAENPRLYGLPIVEVLTLKHHTTDSLDVGSSITLSVHFVNLKQF